MHSNNFVVAAVVNNQIMREIKDESGNTLVHVPFMSDYALRFKNLYSDRKAVATVFIDGKVVSGNGIVIDENETTDLEGEIINSVVENKFRFIERTSEIETHRGIQMEDGIICVKIRFEEEKAECKPWLPPFPPMRDRYSLRTEDIRGMVHPAIATNQTTYSTQAMPMSTSYGARSTPSFVATDDKGITVAGEETNVVYQRVNVRRLDPKETIFTFRLVGRVEEKLVETPVTVKTKKKCQTCGKVWNYDIKYCGSCGTFLKH